MAWPLALNFDVAALADLRDDALRDHLSAVGAARHAQGLTHAPQVAQRRVEADAGELRAGGVGPDIGVVLRADARQIRSDSSVA